MTILMVALTFGLLCLAVVLTILTLWRFFSWGARFTMLKAWLRAQHYIVETAIKYFKRLKNYGLTKVACQIAVICSVVVWVGIVAAFAFSELFLEAMVVIVAALIGFFYAGWRNKGPRARFFRFSRGFLEPTMVLAIPTFMAKTGDFFFKLLVAAIRSVV